MNKILVQNLLSVSASGEWKLRQHEVKRLSPFNWQEKGVRVAVLTMETRDSCWGPDDALRCGILGQVGWRGHCKAPSDPERMGFA